MWLARSQWFFQDEWDFLIGREITSLNDLVRPHTQHWSTIPIIIYRLLFAGFGIDTYLPYLGVLVALNVAIGWAVSELLRRHGAPTPIALLAGLLIILFGPGVENIAWAFQIGFVLSLLCFLLALLSLGRGSRRNDLLPCGLLLASVMSSGLGLSFTLAIGLGLIAQGERRRALRVALIPLVAYGVWFLAFREQLSGHQGPDFLASILLLPKYVAHGMSDALSGLFGLGLPVGPALLVLLGILLLVSVGGKRAWPPPLAAISAMTAVLLVYLSVGLVRASVFGIEQAGTSRYTHIGGTLLVVALGTHLFASRIIPTPLPRRALVAVTVILTVLVLDSAVTLREGIHKQTSARLDQRDSVAAILDILASDEPGPLLNQARPVPMTAITVRRMRELVDAGILHPLESVDLPTGVRLEVLRRMQFAWLTRRPDAPALAWDLADLVRVSVQSLDSRCLTVLADSDEPQVLLGVEGGGVLEVRSESGGTIVAFLGIDGDFQEAASLPFEIAPGATVWLRVADTGEEPQRLRIDPPPGDIVEVCGQEM
jgi:hypothetical protein